MKKGILLILILSAVFQSINVSAQRKGFSLGIEGGPGIRTLYGDGVSDLHSTTGFAVGLTAQYSFSEMLSLRSGISYDLKGATEKDITFSDNAGNEIGVGDLDYNFEYLSLPFMFRATITMDDFSVFGNLGVFGAYLTKEETKVRDVDIEGGNSIDLTDRYTDFDMGSALGLGAMFTIKDMFNISLEVRNYMGFTDINNYENGDQTKTMSTMLLIGFSHYFGNEE